MIRKLFTLPSFLTLLGLCTAANTHAVSITAATGGSNLSADLAQNATLTTPTFTTLGNIVLTESANSDFTNVTSGTIIFSAPAGWRFNAGVGSVSVQNGRNISAPSIAVASGTITVTITVSGADKTDILTISGIQVQSTDGATLPNAGNITRTGGTAGVAGLGVGTSVGSLSQVVGSARKLGIQTQPGTPATAGVNFSPQPVIRIQDQFGSLRSGDNSTVVTAARSGGTGTLQGTLTATASGGLASFSTLNHQVANTITILFTSGALTSITSGSVLVNPASASQMVIQTQPGSTATAGVAFSPQPVLILRDAFGNTVTTDSSTVVTASRNGGTGTLQGNLTAQAASGVVSFANLSHNVANAITVTFTAGSLSVTSGTITVGPAGASRLGLSAAPTSATAGVAFSPQPVVRIEDAFGNLVTSDNTSVVTAARGNGAGTLQGSLTAVASGGLASFVNLSHQVANTITLNFTCPSLTGVSSGDVVINPAAADRLAFTTQPADGVVGAPLATQPVVKTRDAFGNNSTVGLPASKNVTLSLTGGSGPLLGTVTVDLGTGAGNGTATFANVRIDSAGADKVLTASAPGVPTLAGAVSSTFSVAAADSTTVANSQSTTYNPAAHLVALSATVTGPIVVNEGTVTFTVKQGLTVIGSPVTSGTVSAGAAGVSYLVPAGTPTGSYAIEAAFNGSTSFNPSSGTSTLTISPAAQSITFDPIGNQSYGVAPLTLTATASSGLAVSFSIVSGPASISGNTLTITGAGVVKVRASQAGDANYLAAPDADQTFNVLPASLTLSADNASRVYGDANPTFTGSIVGVQYSDNLTVIFTTTAVPGSAVGTYAIVPVLVDPDHKAANYTVTVNNGTLTITPAPLTVTADNKSRSYGAADPTFTGSLVGVRNGDNITASYSTAATATSPVGTYAITPSLSDLDSKLGNYTVTSNNGILTVTPALLTGTADDKSRAYGATNPLFTVTYTGFVNGEDAGIVTGELVGTTTAETNSPVGQYPINVSGQSAPNYTIAYVDGVLTVTEAELTITVDNQSRLYGAPNPPLTGSLSGLQAGDNITATYSTTADVTSPVGGYPIEVALDDPDGRLSNYTVVTNLGTLTITPAPLTVTADDQSREYGAADPVFTGTLVGIQNGDNITASYSTAATVTSPVGTYAIVPALADPDSKLGNYTVTSINGTLTITPAPLMVTADDQSREYGAADPVFTGSLVGVRNGDDITASYSTTATVLSPVGTYPIVPALADPDGKLGNYAVTSVNGSLTITPAPLMVTADNQSREYGLPNPVFTGSVVGVRNGDDITASYSTAATETTPVGTYPIVPALADPDSKLGNYTVTVNNGTLTITAAPLTVTAANQSREYGAADPVFTGTLVGVRNGDNITASYGTAATVTSPVGTYPIVPALADPDGKLGNYAVTAINGTLTITPAPLSVTAANKSRAYGAADPTFTGTLVGVRNSDNITANYSTTAIATSPVGPYPITPSLSDPDAKLGNYTVTSNNGILTVTPALLTGTADDKSRAYGVTNPVFTVTYTGFVNGEDASLVTGELVGTTTAETNSPVGQYPISVSGQSAPNYTIAYVDGILTVTESQLTITVDNQSRAYGAPNPPLTGTLTGLQPGDNITATYSTAADATSPVGGYTINVALDDPDGRLVNYTVITNLGTLTITPAPLTVTADNQSREYGAADPVFTGSLVGVLNGDNVTASYSTAATATSPVGTYDIVPALADPDNKLGNYTLTSNNGTLTVTPAPLTVTADNKSREYGAADPVFTGSLVGVRNGDNITASYSTAATVLSPVGTYPIMPALADPGGKLGNYSVTSNNGTLTISPAPLTVTADNKSREYGAADPVFTGSLVGVRNGDNITASYGTVATVLSPVGTYPIVPVLADPDSKLGNYTVTSNNGTLTVTPAPLTVTADNKSREYGAADPAFTGSLVGVRNGDNITASYSTAATVLSPVGTYPIVPALADPDSKLGNYAVTSNNGTLTVTPAPLTVTADNKSREYGAADPAFTGSLVGVRNGDNITASYSTAATVLRPVGTYPIVPALADPDSKLGNYTVTSNNGTLTITPAPLTVTADDKSRDYGAANPAFTGSLVGVRNGDNITASFGTVATVTSPVGTYPIVPALADPDSKLGNYGVTSHNGTLTITPVPLSVTADNKSRSYGAADPTFTGTIVGLKNGDNITATYSTTAAATSPVGPYPITPSLVDPDGKLGNYTVTTHNGILTVTPAQLTGTADDKSRGYGKTNPVFTVTYTGFVNGETDSIVTGELIGTTTADTNSPADQYPISVSGQSAPNYTIVYVDGILTVTAGELTITVDPKTRLYGDVNPELTGTVSGLLGDDVITASYSTTATATSPVGSYPILVTLNDPDGRLGNYTVITNGANLTVTPAPLSATADDQTRTYGAADPAFTGTLTGVRNGDNITATYTTAATAASAVGGYPIQPVLADPDGKLGNYTVSLVNGTLTITPAALSVTADNKTREYGAADPAFTGTLLGVLNGDNITASYSTVATITSPVGTYPIVPALADPDSKLGNYTVTVNNGTLTITPAPLTATADNQSREYGLANPALTGSLAGVRNGDNITASFSTAATAASPVGTYPIVPALADPDSKLGNYTVVLLNGTLTVTPAPLSVTADDKSREYGTANPAFTGTLTGVRNGDAITASYSTAATQASAVGTYPIVPALADPDSKLGNYTVTSHNGTLTITAAPLTVTADDKTRGYGAADPAFTGTIVGLRNSDNITASYATTATVTSHVGAYPIVPTLADPDSKLGNYAVTLHNGTLIITAVPLLVQAENKSRLYGAANPVFTAAYTGFVNGDTPASLTTPVSFATTATPASNVGTYPITPSGAASADYVISYADGVLTVTPAPLTITADDKTKSFLAALPTLTASYSGFVNGDTPASLDTPATLSTTATVTSPVGTYPITVTGAADLNYTITFINGTMTVVDLSPQISIAGISGGDVTLHITCQPGTTLDVEQTTDFVTWTQITQLTVETGAAVYVDVGGGNGAQKFYRLKVVQ